MHLSPPFSRLAELVLAVSATVVSPEGSSGKFDWTTRLSEDWAFTDSFRGYFRGLPLLLGVGNGDSVKFTVALSFDSEICCLGGSEVGAALSCCCEATYDILLAAVCITSVESTDESSDSAIEGSAALSTEFRCFGGRPLFFAVAV